MPGDYAWGTRATTTCARRRGPNTKLEGERMQNWNDERMERVIKRLERQAQGFESKRMVVLCNVVAAAFREELERDQLQAPWVDGEEGE